MHITIGWRKKDDSDFLLCSVENQAGDEVYLMLGADRVFTDTGQRLLEEVFGVVLANDIRMTEAYRACEYEYSQGQREVF